MIQITRRTAMLVTALICLAIGVECLILIWINS